MNNLSLPEGMAPEEDKDVLGSGGVLESGVYKGTIEMVYLDASDSGAKRINIHFKRGESVVKNTTYISARPDDPAKPDEVRFTYIDKKTGNPKPLPGYSQMNAFFEATTGKGITDQPSEVKMVKVYNYEAKKELPTEVTVFTGPIGKEIAIGILKISEEKATKESRYKQGTGEFREYNEFAKYFDANNGQTTAEKEAGVSVAEFLPKWKDKHTGKTRVKRAAIPSTTPTGATAGAPTAAVADPFA